MKSVPDMRHKRSIANIAAIKICIVFAFSEDRGTVVVRRRTSWATFELASSRNKIHSHVCEVGFALHRAFPP